MSNTISKRFVAFILTLLMLLEMAPAAWAIELLSAGTPVQTYCEVTFKDAKGEGQDITQFVLAGEQLRTLPQPPSDETEDGTARIFMGWFDGETEYKEGSTIAKDMMKPLTLVARFRDAKVYEVTIEYLSEESKKTLVPMIKAQYIEGSSVKDEYKSPSVANMALVDEDQAVITIDASTLDGDRNIEVLYKKADAKYTVTHLFETLEGEYESLASVPDDQYEGIAGRKVSAKPSNNTPEGYTFSRVDSNTDIVLANRMKLTAKYLRNENTLLFDTMGAGSVDPITAKYGTKIEETQFATPMREGYTFTGWYTDSACDASTKIDMTNYAMPAVSQTLLYAGWDSGLVDYQIVCWFENEGIIGSPLGEETLTFPNDYYVGYTATGQAKAGEDVQLSEAEAVAAIYASNIKSPILIGSKRTTEITVEKYLETFFKMVGSDEVTVNGDGTTVLNVWFRRKTFTVEFVDYLTFDGKKYAEAIYVGTGNNRKKITSDTYNMQVKLGQSMEEIWPCAIDYVEEKHKQGYVFGDWSGYYSFYNKGVFNVAVWDIIFNQGYSTEMKKGVQEGQFKPRKHFVYRMYYMELLDQTQDYTGVEGVEYFNKKWFKYDERYTTGYSQGTEKESAVPVCTGWPGSSSLPGFFQPNPAADGSDMTKTLIKIMDPETNKISKSATKPTSCSTSCTTMPGASNTTLNLSCLRAAGRSTPSRAYTTRRRSRTMSRHLTTSPMSRAKPRTSKTASPIPSVAGSTTKISRNRSIGPRTKSRRGRCSSM